MKYLLLLCLIAFCKSSTGQDDFLLLKKRNGFVKERFFSGKKINFRGNDHADHEGYITGIREDTVYYDYYFIRLMPTPTGGIWPDTLQTYHLKYNYKDIVWINYTRNRLRGRRMGTFLQTGGIAMAGIGIFNGLRNHEKGKDLFSGTYLYLAPALYVSGWLLKHTDAKRKVIGKKYTLQYIRLTDRKPVPE